MSVVLLIWILIVVLEHNGELRLNIYHLQVVCFDSCENLSPSFEIVKYFQSDCSVPNIKYNYGVIQKFNSYKCENYCLLFFYNYYTQKKSHLLIT